MYLYNFTKGVITYEIIPAKLDDNVPQDRLHYWQIEVTLRTDFKKGCLKKVKPITKWNAAIGNFALQWNKFFPLFCFFFGLWHIPCFFFISFQTPSPTCIKSRLGILVAYQIKSIGGELRCSCFHSNLPFFILNSETIFRILSNLDLTYFTFA